MKTVHKPSVLSLNRKFKKGIQSRSMFVSLPRIVLIDDRFMAGLPLYDLNGAELHHVISERLRPKNGKVDGNRVLVPQFEISHQSEATASANADMAAQLAIDAIRKDEDRLFLSIVRAVVKMHPKYASKAKCINGDKLFSTVARMERGDVILDKILVHPERFSALAGISREWWVKIVGDRHAEFSRTSQKEFEQSWKIATVGRVGIYCCLSVPKDMVMCCAEPCFVGVVTDKQGLSMADVAGKVFPLVFEQIGMLMHGRAASLQVINIIP